MKYSVSLKPLRKGERRNHESAKLAYFCRSNAFVGRDALGAPLCGNAAPQPEMPPSSWMNTSMRTGSGIMQR